MPENVGQGGGEGSGASGNGGRPGPITELRRDLSCFDITMIGVGAMIGAGIFVLTGIAAGTAGPALILTFAFNGVVALFTAMVYAELGSAIPEAGGGYLWIKEGLPGGNAFLAGWMSWFAHAVAGSLYALGFGAYFGMALNTLLGITTGPWLATALAVAIVLIFVYINYRGASETGLAGNIVTVAKVLILIFFIGSGLWAMVTHPDAMSKFTPLAPKGSMGIFAAMGLTFIAFEGYEIIVQAGEEVKQPRRNVPRAVFWCMAIVVPIYILVAFVALGAVTPPEGQATWQWLGEHKELGLVNAAAQFMPLGTALLLLGGVLSTMSALNATTFSSTRVSFAMGRDRNLPDRFAHIHHRTHTPVVALLASGTIILGMAVFVPIEHVAAAADIMFLLLFLQVNVAAITIRKKYGDKLRYGYLMPFFPVVPVIGITANLLLAAFMFYRYMWPAGIVAIGWLGVGWGLWMLYAKPRERAKGVTPVLISERVPPAKERFRVLVPIANPASAEGLMRFATRLAMARDGEIIVLYALVVPAQLPPSAARGMIREARPVIDRAMEYAEKAGVPVSALARVSHAAAWRAIVDTIQQYDIDFAVMGWRGRSRDPRTIVGSNIDKVISRARCDVVVIQNPSAKPASHVLVPVADPKGGPLLLQVGRLLSDGAQRGIDVLHVILPGYAEQGAESLATLKEMVDQVSGGAPDGPPVRLVREDSADPVGVILRRSEDCDAVVIGATRQSWFRRRMFNTTPQRLAARLRCPLILVSHGAGGIKHNVQSFFDFFQDLEGKAEEEAEEAAAKGPQPTPAGNDSGE